MSSTTSDKAAEIIEEEGKEKKKEEKKEESETGLDEEEATGTIKLIAKDKREFSVEKKFVCISTLVKTTLEQDKAAAEVPIPGVTSGILMHVISYMDHHKGTEPPMRLQVFFLVFLEKKHKSNCVTSR